MINGPPATAFLNHLPELVGDMTSLKGSSPLMDAALDCELKCYFMLPLFDPSTSPYCVGVIECSVEDFELFTIFKEMTHALKSVGLKYTPCQTRTREIKEALEIVCESPDLAAAQVWIPYKNPSSLEGIQTNKQMFAVKYTGYCSADLDDDHLLSAVKDYYDTCDTLPLKIKHGVVGRILETYKPHFCIDIYEPCANKEMRNKKLLGLLPATNNKEIGNKKLSELLPATVECSCLGICLRSIDTGDLDYAFEFLWPRKRNYIILLEALFSTLKRCLPSFKFASGSKLGDRLRVVDVENSTGSGMGFFNILEGKRLSPIPKALEEARRQVAEDCMEVRGKTNPILLPQEKDLKQLHARRFMQKRKLSDMYDSHSESIADNNMEVRGKINSIPLLLQEEDLKQQHAGRFMQKRKLGTCTTFIVNNRADEDFLLPFQVEYADEVLEFHLPTSLAMVLALKNQINERWELKPGTYKLKYLDEDGDWILMNCDEHLRHGIRCYKNIDGTPIRLLVPPLAP
uniref:protein NLP6-like n=1 Tax=Erigeron canadensis TaxID=72917 RepID=UPI001CB9792B|nr:protein NLP6-like [Erigeron canadensis]